MLRRKALEQFAAWRDEHGKRALLVTGARQVGKTYLVREFLHAEYENVIEFDLVEQGDVCEAFDAARNGDELFMAISAFAGQRLVPGKTAIFIDEVQRCKEVVTAIKYLVQRESYDYVLSGSLLGVELRGVRSLPVGYVRIVDMYPLDFEEFCWANGVGDDVVVEPLVGGHGQHVVLVRQKRSTGHLGLEVVYGLALVGEDEALCLVGVAAQHAAYAVGDEAAGVSGSVGQAHAHLVVGDLYGDLALHVVDAGEDAVELLLVGLESVEAGTTLGLPAGEAVGEEHRPLPFPRQHGVALEVPAGLEGVPVVF